MHRNNNPSWTTLKSPGRAECCSGNEIRKTLIPAIVARKAKRRFRATMGENVAFTFFPMDGPPSLSLTHSLFLSFYCRHLMVCFSNKPSSFSFKRGCSMLDIQRGACIFFLCFPFSSFSLFSRILKRRVNVKND